MHRCFAPVVSRSQRARQQHFFGVVLHAPGEVFPVPHRRMRFPFDVAVGHVRLIVGRRPARHGELIVDDLHQRRHDVTAAIGCQPHQLAAFVPVAEYVSRGAAVQRAEARHVGELVAEEAAVGLHPDLLDALQPAAFECVVALRFARQLRAGVVVGTALHRVGAVAADAVDNHDGAVLERAHGEGAVGMRQMMRDGDDLVARPVQRMFCGVTSLVFRQEARHVLIDQPVFHLRHRQDVAIADHQLDIGQRDTFGIEAIIDHLFVEAGGVFFAGDALLLDRIDDGAIAQQAGTDVVIVGIEAEDVSRCGHGHFLSRRAGKSECRFRTENSERQYRKWKAGRARAILFMFLFMLMNAMCGVCRAA